MDNNSGHYDRRNGSYHYHYYNNDTRYVPQQQVSKEYIKNQKEILERGRKERERIYKSGRRKTQKEILDDLFAPGEARAAAYQAKRKAEAKKKQKAIARKKRQ